ncbi:hypothetical protein SK355_06120 [Candidatus Fukatsuia symbiotica]|uniref:Uncharacterized protein n=1 Tax=Candidatus Fukatsuia symbiotica TaxID=1878942 RepID=A0A2U8I5W5_9GAMM|nr:hypothetical protein [Candidatus Fukatsuia symbiotica]AWK14556.1 hypothetical protein CCS41_08840 [Candidatus Fukatsuia symbiotica]MEA9444854.1 hypothetical protein [Candidatus Fukatsuia symbiotica]
MNSVMAVPVLNTNNVQIVSEKIAVVRKNAVTSEKIEILGSASHELPLSLALSYPRPPTPSPDQLDKAGGFYNGIAQLAESMSLFSPNRHSVLSAAKPVKFIPVVPFGVLTGLAVITARFF